MRACPDREELLLARASGTLDAQDAAALDAHLASCEGCRGELAALESTLAAVRLPPPGARERMLEQALPARVLAAASAHRGIGPRWRAGLGAALAAAAAFALWLAVPRLARGPRAREEAPAAVVEPAPGESESTSDDDADALEEWAASTEPLADELTQAEPDLTNPERMDGR